mgnify:CR=1 FL=1
MVKNAIIWIFGLGIALVSGLTAAGAITKNTAPELAVSLHPANGFASETLASNSLKVAVAANGGLFPDSVDPAAVTFAKQAFRSEPITPEAIGVFALANTEGNKREIMREAFALSRRQQLVTGWMILDAGSREDIPAILSYYDTMLRTSSSAASVVIPTIAGALSNTSFIEPFADLLAKGPPWARRFWETVAVTPGSIENAARLRERLFTPNEENESYRDSSLINALVTSERFEAADTLYQMLAGDKNTRSPLHNGSFEHEPEYPPFDWQLFSNGEYGAAITGGSLQLSAIPSSGGVFARQLVKLPRAIFEISVKSDAGISDDATISIEIKCAEKLATTPQPIRISLTGTLTARQISNEQSECRFYWLELVGRSAERGGGFDVNLDSIALRLK